MRRLFAASLTIGAALALGAGIPARPAAGVVEAEFIVIPLRIHLLAAEKAPELHCRLQPGDVERIVAKANRIWREAGLLFYIESIHQEEAAFQEQYVALGENRTLQHLQLVRPRATRAARMFHVYYIHEMGPNGVILDSDPDLIFVKDAAQLTNVPGGIDEPLPRVTAHEIGHGLGLSHRQGGANLMASGTTGVSLSEREIAVARATAAQLDWGHSPEAAERRAAERPHEARALWQALALLPGDGPIATRARDHLAE